MRCFVRSDFSGSYEWKLRKTHPNASHMKLCWCDYDMNVLRLDGVAFGVYKRMNENKNRRHILLLSNLKNKITFILNVLLLSVKLRRVRSDEEEMVKVKLYLTFSITFTRKQKVNGYIQNNAMCYLAIQPILCCTNIHTIQMNSFISNNFICMVCLVHLDRFIEL